MKTTSVLKASTFGLFAVAILASSSWRVNAGAIRLSDQELDGVTAGGTFVFSTADAQALAAYRAFGQAASNTITGTNEGVQPGFQSEGGLASGVAVSFGINGSRQAPPPTSSTSVTTGGVANGNFRLTIAGGGTSSALGLTIQTGVTSVYGVWVPGM